jgi:hypothetical protein
MSPKKQSLFKKTSRRFRQGAPLLYSWLSSSKFGTILSPQRAARNHHETRQTTTFLYSVHDAIRVLPDGCQLDVTEVVTTTYFTNKPATTAWFPIKWKWNCKIPQQLWWMLKQMNPLHDVLRMSNTFFQPHPERFASCLVGTSDVWCTQKIYMQQQQQQQSSHQAAVYKCPIGTRNK